MRNSYNLIINDNSFALTLENAQPQEEWQLIIANLKEAGISPVIYEQAGDVAGSRVAETETKIIYTYPIEKLQDFLRSFLKPLNHVLYKFNEDYKKFTRDETTTLALNKSWEEILKLAQTLLDYKQKIGVDSSIPVLKELRISIPTVDHHADGAATILAGFAEDLMPMIKKVVCERQAGSNAAWELYIDLLLQAKNIVRHHEDAKTHYSQYAFKNLTLLRNTLSCKEQLDASPLIAYIKAGSVTEAENFFYNNESNQGFSDYRKKLQGTTTEKFNSFVDKVEQLDLDTFFAGNVSFQVLLLALFVERRDHVAQQTKLSVNTSASFYQSADRGSATTHVVTQSADSSVVTKRM